MFHKKEIILITLLFLVCLVLPMTTQAATYYLDAVDGDDSNPGTSEQSWKTLNRAYTWYSGTGTKVQEGDTVLFRNGNYGVFVESTRYNPGERWLFYRNNWITYKAAPGHTPILTGIEVHNEDKWPPIEHGRSYLIFDGFRILTGASFAYTSYVKILNCNITGSAESYEGLYAPYFPFNSKGVSANGCGHITIEDCDISHTYRGISVAGADDVIIRNNKVHYFGEDGITGPAYNITIDRNEIYDCNKYRTTIDIYGTGSGVFQNGETIIQEGTGAIGIYSMKPSTSYLIYQTTETNFKNQNEGGGTIIGQSSGATISSITRVDPQHTDGIAFHGNASNAAITNNVIHPKTWDGIKIATYAGGLVENITIANNLIYDTADYAMYIGTDPGTGQATYRNVNIYNNTFYGGARKLHLRDWSKIENLYNNIITKLMIDSISKGVVNHGNNIFIEDPGAFKNETEIVTTTPGFVDPNVDFRPAPGSMAINFGSPDYGPKTDILGNLRDSQPDAGAYEYISSTPPPPPSILYGDISGDNVVNLSDALMAAQSSVGLIILNSDQTKKGDVNGDGKVSAYDAALILQKIAGLISKFPKE